MAYFSYFLVQTAFDVASALARASLNHDYIEYTGQQKQVKMGTADIVAKHKHLRACRPFPLLVSKPWATAM